MAEGVPATSLGAELTRARWLLQLPALLSGLVAGPLATCYAAEVLPLPPGGMGVLLGAVAVLLPLLLGLLSLRLSGRMAALRQVASGQAAPGPEPLKAALREVGRLPDFTFANAFLIWALAVAGLCAAFLLFAPDTRLELLLRLGLLGLLLSPITGVIAHLGTARLGRRTIARIAREGLSAQDVFEALPPRRHRLRALLVFFILSYALPPMILAVDAAFTVGAREMAAVLAEEDAQRQQALAEAAGSRVGWPVAGLCALAALTALGTALIAGSSLRAPMREIVEQATRLIDGRLDRASLVIAEDESWVVSAAFTRMREELARALAQLQQAGLRLSTSSEQLVETFGQQEAGAAEQASALNETSATTEELARSAAQIAENAGAVAQVAEKTLLSAQAGQRSSEAFFASMQRMRQDNQAVADSVLKLNKRVQQIGKIVEFINGIADKSDLLALNAELEGTKAGEVGRGFSLVAAEMRRLAENVLKSTQEIGRLIQEIRDATHAAVMATEAGLKATERGTSTANLVLESLRQIVGLARSTSDAVRSISLATQQQQSGTDQLAEAMAEILRVTQQGSVATRQMSGANLELATLAKDLKAVVDRFQVDNV